MFARRAFPGDVEFVRDHVWATVQVLSGLSGEPGDVPDGRIVRWSKDLAPPASR